MIHCDALTLLRRHTPLPFDWCEVVVGYDFGILSMREIQHWIRTAGTPGEAAGRLAGLEGPALLRFEETLWAACVEATRARVPRPGHRRWALAQDLWRVTLLKEALSSPLDDLQFGESIEAVIDQVGSPEDMLSLVSPGCAWAGTAASADRFAVASFVQDLEQRLLARENGWISLAAS